MSLRDGIFADPITAIPPLCGSEISDLLASQLSVLSGYWESDTSANQYFVWDEEIVDATGYYISGGSIWASASTYSVSSVSAYPSSWITYILDSVGSNVNKILFEKASGGTITFGYTNITTGGDPVGDSYGARPNLAAYWNDMLSSNGLYPNFLLSSDMQGANGWVTRLWNPYLGIKREMMLNNDVLYDICGWWTSGISSFPCGTPSQLCPVNTTYYANAYVTAYHAIDEYLYNWSSIVEGYTSAEVQFVSTGYYNAFLNDTITGYWNNALTAVQEAAARINPNSDDQGAGSDARFLFTAADGAYNTETGYEYNMDDFRLTGYINGLRQAYDSSAFYLPTSGYQDTSARIWDDGTRRVLHYLLKNFTPFDIIRAFIPSAY